MLGTQSGPLPAWCGELKRRLSLMAEELERELVPYEGSECFRPEDFGYIPEEMATASIQRAIDSAAKSGGTVRLEHGDYTSGTLVLRSNVFLEVCAGARLLGSCDLNDYPEHHAARLTVQDTSMGMHQSLIFAEGCHNVGLVGEGVIDGQGTPDHFPGAETAQGTPGRPFLIRMIDCKDVQVRGLTLKNAACWMQNYLNCDRLLFEDVTVRNHANYNNDGFDIDSCRDVLIRRCRVTSGDDALCFKGAGQRTLCRVLVEDCDFYSACNAVKVGTDTQGDFRDVLIRRCAVGGLAEDPSGLKHPCADSGISLEMADGGTLENFLLEDLHITRAFSPFFFRLQNRGRVRPQDPAPGVGTLRRVLIERVRGRGNGPRGSYMLGLPEKAISDIAFSDISLRQYAWRASIPVPPEDSALLDAYPDAHMIDPYGPSPARGLWTRHVQGLALRQFVAETDGADTRPEALFEDTRLS